MDEKTGTRVALLIPWGLTVAATLVGLWQYTDNRAQENKAPFLQRQMDELFAASEAVAVLATTTDIEAWKRSRDKFWALYWGPLIVVENAGVESAMVEAGNLIPRPGVTPPDSLPMSGLQASSRKLGLEARKLILESWDVSLPPLEGKR